MRHRLPILGLAAVYAVALLLIGLWPTHVDRDLDMVDRPPTTWLIALFDLTPSQGYRIGELLANVLLFLPLGALAMGLLRLGWLQVVVLGAVVSILIEIAQTVARPERTGSLLDVVSNTTGAAIGAAVIGLWRLARPAAPAAP